ncbi:MAG: lysine-2,3-aminomutase-like protein [Hyphomicrobiaceae bacterium]|nr:lysine-2,3-aminomutase-like protein [Hyphomicrobiaceae bacterium]
MTKPLQTLRTAGDVVAAGLAPQDREEGIARVEQRYAVAISPAIAELIDPCDPDDPIARQFVPDARELDHTLAERADPIGDEVHSPVPGIVHRYPDRVLLKIASVCPVYCRFCFRREMVGPEHGHALSPAELDAALTYIRARPEIWEVILTGGDPFVLSDRRIAEITQKLSAIDHVKIMRWHTRVPVVQPERVTDQLVSALTPSNSDTTIWVALHANHARELTPQARTACRKLINRGITLVSQSVLLKGVNDDVETLASLMRAFVETGIKPYYLHHPDLAPGTAHLRVGIADGRALMRALRGRLSGLAQPTYVLDIPGGYGKAPIGPDYLKESSEGFAQVEDWNGNQHRYEP